MPLYHGSGRIYQSGDVIEPPAGGPMYPEVVVALEAARPRGAPSRWACVFAAESVVAATAFAHGQQIDIDPTVYVYEVEMEPSFRAPFALVHEIRERLKKGLNPDSLVNEYWTRVSVQDWVMWEVFGPSFKVICSVTPENLGKVYLFKERYDADRKVCASL